MGFVLNHFIIISITKILVLKVLILKTVQFPERLADSKFNLKCGKKAFQYYLNCVICLWLISSKRFIRKDFFFLYELLLGKLIPGCSDWRYDNSVLKTCRHVLLLTMSCNVVCVMKHVCWDQGAEEK